MNQILNNTLRIKQLNIEMVKSALIDLTYATRLTISNVTGLSVATCGNILNDLLENGEAIEIDSEQPNGGRPAKRFMYNANHRYVACIFISCNEGIHQITYAVANMIGEIIERKKVVFDYIDYDSIEDTARKLIEKHKIIKAIGVGVPAAVYEGVVIGDCGIQSLINFPLEKRLKEKFSQKIVVENDKNLIAVGFYKRQNYDDDKNIAVIDVQRGKCISAGIIVDGHIMKGNTNFAGEVSYFLFDIPQKEQIKLLDSGDGLLPLVVKALTSIITVINPDTILLTGNLIKPDMFEDIFSGCLTRIPKEHMPGIIIQEDIYENYMKGLISVITESLGCDIQLVKKKI